MRIFDLVEIDVELLDRLGVQVRLGELPHVALLVEVNQILGLSHLVADAKAGGYISLRILQVLRVIRLLNLIVIHDGVFGLLHRQARFVRGDYSLDVGVVFMAIAVVKVLAELPESFSIDCVDHVAGFVLTCSLLREHVEVLLNLELIIGWARPLVTRGIIDDLIDKVDLRVISAGLRVQTVALRSEALSMLDLGRRRDLERDSQRMAFYFVVLDLVSRLDVYRGHFPVRGVLLFGVPEVWTCDSWIRGENLT